MTQINESAAWNIECIVPAVRIFVLPCLLNPLEDLEERLEFNFAVSQIDVLEPTLVTLSTTFKLHRIDKQGVSCSNKAAVMSIRETALK